MQRGKLFLAWVPTKAKEKNGEIMKTTKLAIIAALLIMVALM
jgi:hypothetical protein